MRFYWEAAGDPMAWPEPGSPSEGECFAVGDDAFAPPGGFVPRAEFVRAKIDFRIIGPRKLVDGGVPSFGPVVSTEPPQDR